MNKEVRIKVRLSEEENEELKRCAGACGMSQSEFIRQLCKGKTPKPNKICRNRSGNVDFKEAGRKNGRNDYL